MTGAPAIVVHVPPPPSANLIWRRVPGKRGMIRSPEYKAWLEEAGWALNRQAPEMTIWGQFRAAVEVPRSRRDVDNWTKPLFDLLQKQHIIENDRLMTSYLVTEADRHDVMISLWPDDSPRPSVRNVAPRKRKATPAALNKLRARKMREGIVF